MKILAIRGCNLASLEGKFEVDFRSEPLRSAGLFAITGNTGAGKTTILDAMCIALYRRSPRLEETSRSTKLAEEGSKGISERDIRTVLRKGKHIGYAEVDFLAVDGKEYRVRWSVSRANNSPTGNLKAATQEITELATGERRTLAVRESQVVIPSLVGLEYEQFTRAVLLAQGNFSALLKADENEKAQMLEKLTDTGIYSNISTAIYTRTQEVKKEVEVIEAKRKALQLLSDEDIEILNTQKQNLTEKQEENKKQVELLKVKRDWLTRLTTLNEEIAQAEKMLSEAKEHLFAAQPTIDRLRHIDSVQQVRDDYMSLRSLKQQCTADAAGLATLEKELEGYDEAFGKACRELESAVAEQDSINKYYIQAQPLINEAAQLEKQYKSDTIAFNELTQEIVSVDAERTRNLNAISTCKSKIETLAKESDTKRQWLEHNAAYKDSIPMIPSIITNIRLIENENMLIGTKSTSLAIAQKLVEKNDVQLAAARKSEEVLRQTMSSEIAALRKRLIDGEPCPVCGSRHHEAVEVASNLLEEKLLEQAREENRLLIEHLENTLANSRVEIKTLRAGIEQHHNTIEQYNAANLSYLKNVADAKELLNNSNAINHLQELASNWNNYKERLVAISNDIALCTNSEANHRTRLGEIEKELECKKSKSQQLRESLEMCKERLSIILDKWKSAGEMQEYYNNAIAEAGKVFVAATEQKSRIDIERNKLNGEIAGKKKHLKDATERIGTLSQKVNDYLAGRKDGMELSRLNDLLSTSHTSIETMRAEIDVLEKALTTATATLAERRQNLDKHLNAPIKPAVNEDDTYMRNLMGELEKMLQGTNGQIIQIDARLLEDVKNKANFKQYSEEYDNMMEQMSQWNTLCNMFGSSNGSTLMKMAQGYTLDILLEVANIHLSEMTKRYKLARMSDNNLGIKVIDLDMMSESRSAHTLSGGETFIVSLALSLALSSLSSNKMSIESLFIDEGFGALDKETLQTALMVLEKLQSRGRKIGIISHLTEMLEQIPVKVCVKKVSPGKSRIEITENKNRQ